MHPEVNTISDIIREENIKNYSFHCALDPNPVSTGFSVKCAGALLTFLPMCVAVFRGSIAE